MIPTRKRCPKPLRGGTKFVLDKLQKDTVNNKYNNYGNCLAHSHVLGVSKIVCGAIINYARNVLRHEIYNIRYIQCGGGCKKDVRLVPLELLLRIIELSLLFKIRNEPETRSRQKVFAQHSIPSDY